MDQLDLFDWAEKDFLTRRDQIVAKLREFLTKNPWLWGAWERECFEMLRTHRRCSANHIYEKIRWDPRCALPVEEGQPKFNSNFRPYLARMFELLHPEHAGCFRKRFCQSVTRRPFAVDQPDISDNRTAADERALEESLRSMVLPGVEPPVADDDVAGGGPDEEE